MVTAFSSHLTGAAFSPFMADVNIGWPGRVWVEANLSEDGLGYQGSYITLGAKQHIFQDFLDGRWLLETRGHYDPEYEGFFANIGIERVISLHAAEAEITTGFWFDYDGDLQGDFAHSMTALGVNASIETRNWEVIGNGYFPIGSSDFAQGDPTGANCFLNHSIVTQAGIDSALQGFERLVELQADLPCNTSTERSVLVVITTDRTLLIHLQESEHA